MKTQFADECFSKSNCRSYHVISEAIIFFNHSSGVTAKRERERMDERERERESFRSGGVCTLSPCTLTFRLSSSQMMSTRECTGGSMIARNKQRERNHRVNQMMGREGEGQGGGRGERLVIFICGVES